jgi:hypothetical protein
MANIRMKIKYAGSLKEGAKFLSRNIQERVNAEKMVTYFNGIGHDRLSKVLLHSKEYICKREPSGISL